MIDARQPGARWTEGGYVNRQKNDVVRAICTEVGVGMIPLGPGSKEKKAVLEAVVRSLELHVDLRLSKPELAAAIVECGGLRWGPECESRGDTVTTEGLERVLAAVLRLKGGAPVAFSSDAGADIGVDYVETDARITAAPRELLLDWAELDESTQEHSALQNRIAALLRDHDIGPRSPKAGEPPYDIAWRGPDGALFVCEVKSATAANRAQQFRLGLGQVLEYRYLLESTLGEPVRAVLAMTTAAPVAHEVCGSHATQVIERATLQEDLARLLDAVG